MNISEQVAMRAAEWLLRLQAPTATQAERVACRAWRESDPAHEHAWQRAMKVSHQLSMLPSGLGLASLNADEKLNRRSTIKTLALLMATGGMSWQAWQSDTTQMYLADYATATGEQREVVLSDGTQIILNTDSAINIAFTHDLRLIEHINGEILISTGKDAGFNRPMLIATAFGQLKPLGTRFNVRQAQDYAELTVIEGAVNITTKGGEQRVLQANQQAKFNQHHIELTTPPQDKVDGWTRGLLSVREMRLAEFAEELARYRKGMIRCAPEVADLRLSGVFQLKDTDVLLNGLSGILPIRVDYLTRYWVTLNPAHP